MKYWNKFSIVLVVAMTLFILGLDAIFNSTLFNSEPNNPIYTLSEGWSVYATGTTYDNVVLSSANIPVQNFNDVVTMSIKLPDYEVIAPVIYFASSLSEVYVYLNEEQIYTFGVDYYDKYLFVPKIYNVVPLPTDFQGKSIKIKLISKDEAAFSGLSEVYLGNRDDISSWHFQTYRLALFVGVFLIIFALILLILSPYIYLFNNKDPRILFSAFISADLGLYILSYNKLIYLFSDQLQLNTFIEFLSLYLVPSVIILYLCTIFTGRNLIIFKVMLAFDIALTILVILLNIFKIVPITRFTIYLHIIVLIEMPITIFLILKDLYKQRKEQSSLQAYTAENIFLFGLLIFMVFSAIDIVKFNIYKYVNTHGEVYASIDFMTIGSLAFMICVLLNYLFYTVNTMNLEAERMHLVGLAYTDVLTGLANRARCEQVMDNLSSSTGEYSIVSMDMDYLKQVNDSFGHEEGDRLIVGFSTILTQVFWDAELIGRMGGDEFIVISKDASSKNWSKKLHELNLAISEWNKKEHKFKYSASIGFASSTEAPGHSAMDVYMLADNRMYSMKNERHKQREEGQTVE